MNAVSHNIRQINNIIDNKVKIMGVVKADAYGHGAVRIAEVLIKEGVEYLAVATIDEALELSKNYKNIHILILGYVPNERLGEAIENSITLTIYNYITAEETSKAAAKLKKKAKAHIKIDVGMNRVGFKSTQLDELIKLKGVSGIEIEGIYTHFPCADSEPEITKAEFAEFVRLCSKMEDVGFKFKYKHCCNSSAIINFPEMHMDMVRPGILIYGLKPHKGIEEERIQIKPAMSFKARIIHIKEVPAGTKISYGGTFTTKKQTKLATLSVGYADGYSRALSNNMNVIINEKLAPIVGRICMDQCMVDVTEIDVKLMDTALLFGKEGKNEISVDEIAEKLNTINYEVVCSIGKRVPQLYIKES